jgi:uncharacterized membrane protein YtjA (UPF0391 family)
MLYYALMFLVLAIVAGVLGFGGFVTGTALLAAKVCVGLFILLFLISLVTGRSPAPPSDPYSY